MNQSQVIEISHTQTLHYTCREEGKKEHMHGPSNQKSTKTPEQRGTPPHHIPLHIPMQYTVKIEQGHVLIHYKSTVHDTDTHSR